MNQLLHNIEKEYKQFKEKEKTKDVYIPSIDGNSNISGFNMLIAILYASNRDLSGEYTTLSSLEEKEILFKKNSPKVKFLDYEITNTILFLEEQVKSVLPKFQENDPELIKEIEILFEKKLLNSFSPYIKNEIEKNLGKVIEINLGKNILNYRKIEAIPNEYILENKKQKEIELSQKELRIKEIKENAKYSSFSEAQQEFYSLLYNFGVANPKMIQNFELYELLNKNLIINSNNNAIIAKNEDIINRNKYKKI